MGSKTGFGKVKWAHHVVNTNRQKTGDVLPTSQGPVVFDKDTALVKNEEQARELKEKYPQFIRTVDREPPMASSRATFLMPDTSHIFRKKNRMGVQEREEEERERRERGYFDDE